jgi:hypothetical protein
MLLTLALLSGCSNLTFPQWATGGHRYATGVATESDTGDTAGSDDTGADANAPVLGTASAVFEENFDGADHTYISVGIDFTDSPGGVEGGVLYFTDLGDGETLEESSRPIVGEDEEADPNTEAGILNELLSFNVGPVDEGLTHQLEVYVVDYTHNESNEITIDVTGE